MIKILFAATLLYITSIYSISFTANTGGNVSFNTFHGKKILLVNIASGSDKIDQLNGLQQLYTQYEDNLTIVAFPSNSFGNEPLSDNAITALCTNTYHITFPLAAKSNVKESGMQPVYQWLADPAANGSMGGITTGDFQKFLISETGELVGSFAPNVLPTDSVLINAITNN